MVVYMKIEHHFIGIFIRYPTISYVDGAEQRFEDVDFTGRNESELFLERFTNEMCVNVYFYMPDIEFPDGLRILATKMDYQEFIEVGYACGCVVDVYMDHLGANVHQWIINELDEVCSPSYNHSGVAEVNEEVPVDGAFQNDPEELKVNIDDDLEHVDCIPMTKTKNDVFLASYPPRSSQPNTVHLMRIHIFRWMTMSQIFMR